jgi:hypothetical protein
VGGLGGLGCAVVAVAAGEVCGEGVEVPDPGAEPVAEHPQRVGCAAEGAVGVVVDHVQQSGNAGPLHPPLVEQGAGSPGRGPDLLLGRFWPGTL